MGRLGAGRVHFVLPYVLLLSRDVKRDWQRLSIIAAWVVGIRLLDYYWHVAPEFHTERAVGRRSSTSALPIALGGVFVMLFAMQLKGRPLLPRQDGKALATRD